MVEWTFEAPQTKASLNGNGTFSWSPGDKMAVWNGTAASFVTFSTLNGSGRFSAFAPADAHFTDAAFYPASIAVGTATVQLPSSYSLADLSGGKGMPMFAPVEENSNILHFKHLCAYLSVSVNNVPAEDTQIVLGAENYALSGEFTLETADGEKLINAPSGSGSVTINLSQIQDVQFTIPLPVGTYALSLNVAGKLSVTTDPVEFRRAHLYTLSAIDANDSNHFSQTCEVYELEDDDNNWE